SNTIKLRSGTYALTIAGANEDAGAAGDLDITNNVTITGAGSRKTVIDGNYLDRVIEIFRGKVNISGVAIEHGQASVGGGLSNLGGNVTLKSVLVTGNRAPGTAGTVGAIGVGRIGVGSDGGAGGGGGSAMGGGIFNGAGSLSLSNCTIALNK